MRKSITEYKQPVCEKCGVILKGFVPTYVVVICFFCENPNADEGEQDTNWKDKK